MIGALENERLRDLPPDRGRVSSGMFINGIGTAVPETRYSQAECWATLEGSERLMQLAPRSRAILRKVLLGRNGIETRHLALAPLIEAFQVSPDLLQARFSRHAPKLATAAALLALEETGLQASQIDAVLISTCTGYLCPGLTSYVSESLGLRPDVQLLDLVGQGCGAAIPNLRTGEALIRVGARHALSICVEVSSAAFYLDDDPGVLVSACLFGDGAAAAVISAEPIPRRRRVEWRFAETVCSPAERDLLRFESVGGMLRNILSVRVPEVAARHADTVLNQALLRAGMDRSAIAGWILHSGGRDVLNALGQAWGLSAEDTRWSSDVLRRFGNMSSPSCLFALRDALAGGHPGGPWWLASFGAGFTSHGALLEVGS